MLDLLPEVLQAVAVRPYIVHAYMNDGSTREYDVEPAIKKGGVFAPLQNEELFYGRITVLNGTVAWDISGDRDPTKCIDIDPCTIQQQVAV
jgi:hypothetical protein